MFYDTVLPHKDLNCIAAFGPKHGITLLPIPNDYSCLFVAVYCQLWEGEAGTEA